MKISHPAGQHKPEAPRPRPVAQARGTLETDAAVIDAALLESLPLLADANPGPLLRRSQPDFRGPVEALNQFRPDPVRALHAALHDAGARILRTNTAAANPLVLEEADLAERAEAINNSGSALLREAVGSAAAVVMGCVEQIPARWLAEGVVTRERERAYSAQVVYLADTQVDFLLLQHFTRLDEALMVVRIAQRVGDVPVLAQLQVDAAGRTADGLPLAQAAARLLNAGAGALGLSCGPHPEHLPPLLDTLLAHGLPVSVLLGVADPETPAPYPQAPLLTPPVFAQTLAALGRQGATIVGGCCGARPAHIAATARALGRPTADATALPTLA